MRMNCIALLVAAACLAACSGNQTAEPSQQDQRAVIEAILREQRLAGTVWKPLFLSTAASVGLYLDDRESWEYVVKLKPGLVDSLMAANVAGARHEPWLATLGVGMLDDPAFEAFFPELSSRTLDENWERT